MSTRPAAITHVTNAVIYLRLSDLHADDLDEDGNGKTFADRETKVRELAVRLGWNVVKVITENDMFTRNGKQRNASAFKRKMMALPGGGTAMRVDRPGFRSILAMLTDGRANALLAEDLDRCMRDPRDLEDLIDIAEAHKINVRSLSGSLTFTDGGTDGEITMARMMVTMANKSSRDTSRRVRAARERMAGEEDYRGGQRPYGFEVDRVTPRADEAAIIEQASRRVLLIDGRQGHRADSGQRTSLRSLARELREADAPSPTGRPWTPAMLRGVLLRPRNAARKTFRGEEIGDAPWEPIVPLDVFREVQRILDDPARSTVGGRAPRWLGSGIYRCGICDVTSLQVGGGAGHAPRYVCKRISHLSRNAERTDVWVRENLINFLSLPGVIDTLCIEQESTVDAPALRAEARALRLKLNGIAADYALDLLDREQMLTVSATGRARLAEIREQLSNAVSESPFAPFIDADDIGATFDDQPLSARRVIVDSLMTVTLKPTGHQGSVFKPQSVLCERRAAA